MRIPATKGATRLLVLGLVAIAAFATAPPARADLGSQFFALLKEYHPDPDSVEAARYYVYHPAHANTIYGRIASQDYVFAGLVGAAKVARHPPINLTPQQCTLPRDALRMVFAQSSEFIDAHGEDSHVKSLLQEGNDAALAEAESQLASYIPYWGDLPSICHFAFNTTFERETQIRETIEGGWRHLRASYEAFAAGNAATGLSELAFAGLADEFACEFADQIVSGGQIGNTPILGDLAKSACASFAGTVIKGIGTAAGAIVNEVGELIGDAGCALGIGSCGPTVTMNEFLNPYYEILVNREWDAGSGPSPGWKGTVIENMCNGPSIGGVSSFTQQCAHAADLLLQSADHRGNLMQLEAIIAHEQIYEPRFRELVLDTSGGTRQALFDTCVANLLTRYPWPGAQQIDPNEHNRAFRQVCERAYEHKDTPPGNTGTSLSGYGPFSGHIANARQKLQQQIGVCFATTGPMTRSCKTWLAQSQCAKAFVAIGVDRGTADNVHCRIDEASARPALIAKLATIPQCKSTKSIGPIKLPQHTRCFTWGAQGVCRTQARAQAAPEPMVAGCGVDVAAANADVIDTVAGAVGDECSLRGQSFLCLGGDAFEQCKAARGFLAAAPNDVGRCVREIQRPGDSVVTIPRPGDSGGTIPARERHVIGGENDDDDGDARGVAPGYYDGRRPPPARERPPSRDDGYGRRPPGSDYTRVPPESEYSRTRDEPTYSRPHREPAYSRPQSEPAYARPSREPDYGRIRVEPAVSRPSREAAYGRTPAAPAYSRPPAESPPPSRTRDPRPGSTWRESLARRGCSEFAPGELSCSTQAGYDGCERYRASGEVRRCERLSKE